MTSRKRTAALSTTMLLAGLLLSGCLTLRAEVPGVLRSDVDEQVEVIGVLDVEFTRRYTVWGAVSPEQDPELGALLQRKVESAGGDGIANLVVESRFEGWDFFSRVLSLGFLVPRTYRVRGDIVRIHAPAMRGKPLLRRGLSELEDASSPDVAEGGQR